MQHQFNLGSAVQPTPFIPDNDPDAPMFASVEGVANALSEEEFVFQVRGEDRIEVLTTQVLMTLGHCREFRSLDEHIAHIMREVPGMKHHQGVRKSLDLLVQSGLLVSDADVLDWSRQYPLEAAPVGGICIRACDRPDRLECLLASLEDNHQQHGSEHPVLVLDDSRDPAHAARNADLVAAFADQVTAPVHYLGLPQQQELCRRLCADLPQHEDAIHQLLDRQADGFGGGRSWNLALLLTAGRRMFLLDEDFQLPLKSHPDRQDGLLLGQSGNRSAWFHPDQASVMDAGDAVAEDPFALHLRAVGHSVGEVAASEPCKLDRQQLRGRTLQDLRGLVGGYRIATSFVGTRGHSGMAGSSALFLLDEATRQRLYTNRDEYLRNLEGGNVWHGCNRASIAAQGDMTPFAVDNSMLLPCTGAAGRNEDALFNTLLRFCHPHTRGMFFPVTVGHVQESGRAAVKAGRAPWQANVNTFAGETLANHQERCLSADPAQRMRFAADIFADVAGAEEEARMAHLREYLTFERSDIIGRLQQQLTSQADAPVFWQADIRELITVNANAMAGDQPLQFRDWPDGLDGAGYAACLRESMNELATGLRAWPDMWHWAAEQGESLLDTL